LKQLARGVVVTHEVAPGHFEMKIAVVPIVPVESITVQLDPSKFVDDMTDRMTFRDLGM